MSKEKKRKIDAASHVVGVDLGGTKILAAVVNAEGHILAESKQKTKPRDGQDAVIARMAETVRQAVQEAGLGWEKVQAVGIGVPGPMDPETGIVYNPPNLPGWDHVPLGPRLSEELEVPVFLENDVNLGTLGEHALGVGRGTQDMIGIFVGTGIGGGLILDGKLRSGYRNAAAEIGHMILMPDGPVCGCGKRGCVEALASRTAIERDIFLGLAAGRESLMSELTEGGAGRLTSGMLLKAWRRGDPLVTEIIGRVQWYLGLLTASLVNLIDPEMVVFGGGVAQALGEDFLPPICVTARQYFMQQAGADKVRIVTATLGDYAGVLGAAVLAHRQSAPSPTTAKV
jgi:glucokinase